MIRSYGRSTTVHKVKEWYEDVAAKNIEYNEEWDWRDQKEFLNNLPSQIIELVFAQRSTIFTLAIDPIHHLLGEADSERTTHLAAFIRLE